MNPNHGSQPPDELQARQADSAETDKTPSVGSHHSDSGFVPPDEPTVISKRPPLHAVSPHAALSPRELGTTLVGRSLAHFHLVEYVGGGGMGAVFRATDTMLNRTVAVKVLSRDQGQDEETVKRFQNEAQSAARLDHENIARVYFVGEDDGWYFIVFEYIDGQNLRELVQEHGPMPVERALQVTLQVAEALDHAANREVVHRDIKPSNVLLTESGKAKLVDMGLARLRPMHADEGDLTASGVTLGTFDYISPEQARDPRMADSRSDIYSLGCTLYFMLTGQPPFPEGTVLQKLLSHSSEAPADPRNYRHDLPDQLIPVLNKMLAKKPRERYQRPVDLISDLLLLADRLGVSTKNHSAAIWMRSHRTRLDVAATHLPWLVPTVLLIGLALLWDPASLDGTGHSTVQPYFERPITRRVIAPPNNIDDGTTEGNPGKTVESKSASAARPSDEAAGSVPPTRESDTSSTTANGETPSTAETDAGDEPSETERIESASALSMRTVYVDNSPALRNRNGELVVASLSEACRIARQYESVETIEIRQDGRIELSPLTLRLRGRSLRIKASPDHTPLLSFRTGRSVSDFQQDGMLEIFGGTLVLQDLHLEMVVPNETLDGEWALFKTENVRDLQLERCVVTIHNSYGGRYSNLDNVAVFHCVRPDNDLFNPSWAQGQVTSNISLTDCVIRCESSVLRARAALGLNFRWTNGLLITSERLATLGGRSDVPAPEERVALTLQHVTAVVDLGLVDFTSTMSRPYLVPLSISSSECVFVTQPWAPLVTQAGDHSLAEFIAQLDYRGNRTAYEGMESLWSINPQDSSQAESFDFEMWINHTKENAPQQSVPWRYEVNKKRPIHEHRIQDYSLDGTQTENADGEPMGFVRERLPRLLDNDRPIPPKTRPQFQS